MNKVTFESTSGAETIRTSCFQLRFWHHEDHWRYEIVSQGPTASIPRIVPVEPLVDRQDHDRIINPTYQQIHLDRDAKGGVRAMLVGQAGPHHFSAVFHVHEDAGGATIDVDVADRCLRPIHALAATYAVDASHGQWGSVNVTDPDGQEHTNIVLDASNPVCHLVFEVDLPGQATLEAANLARIRVQALAKLDPSQQTHRFRYRWNWVKDPRPAVWDRTT